MTDTPAFPVGQYGHSEGMTLRDYFAAKAMQAIIAKGCAPGLAAMSAYWFADAMMEQREKPE